MSRYNSIHDDVIVLESHCDPAPAHILVMPYHRHGQELNSQRCKSYFTVHYFQLCVDKKFVFFLLLLIFYWVFHILLQLTCMNISMYIVQCTLYNVHLTVTLFENMVCICGALEYVHCTSSVVGSNLLTLKIEERL